MHSSCQHPWAAPDETWARRQHAGAPGSDLETS
jgi:hypothetical protein